MFYIRKQDFVYLSISRYRCFLGKIYGGKIWQISGGKGDSYQTMVIRWDTTTRSYYNKMFHKQCKFVHGVLF